MTQDKIGIIIQARMGSSRLPGKILKPLGDKLLLEYITSCLQFLKTDVKVVIATSNHQADDIVEKFCKDRDIECFRGSENNVLERYYLCAEKYKFSQITRLTGDNPFCDIEELDNLIELHLESNSDYTSSFEVLPIGVGAEIFTFKALAKSYLEGKEPHHIEHVDEYIIENPDIFKTTKLSVPPDKNRPDVRLTVDTEDDYNKACFIVQNGSDYIKTVNLIILSEKYQEGLGQ